MSNIGIDLAVFNYQLEMNADFYIKKTSDMLVPDSYTPLAGSVQAPFINLGDMQNKGFDLSLIHRGKFGPFSYDVTATVSKYKNEVIKISNDDKFKMLGSTDGSGRLGALTATSKGQPVSYFYGFVVDGIYKSKEEVQNGPTQSGITKADAEHPNAWYSGLGHYKFKDLNGDGVINGSDETNIGSPHPDYTYSFDLNLYYQNWEVNMFFYGSKGNKIYNYVKYWTDFNGSFVGNRSTRVISDSWTMGNTADTKLPLLTQDNVIDAGVSSSYYVEDGSFFRMKNLQIAYKVPASFLSKVHVDNLKFYVQATNLFTKTKYTGIDPDLGNQSTASGLAGNNTGRDLTRGVDYGNYPTPRQFLLGVVLGF
jgi:hypothetical protein